MSIVDDNMTPLELWEDIQRELDDWEKGYMLPGRAKITKERMQTLLWKFPAISKQLDKERRARAEAEDNARASIKLTNERKNHVQ